MFLVENLPKESSESASEPLGKVLPMDIMYMEVDLPRKLLVSYS